MITLDRSSTQPLHDQLAERLRYLIASGQLPVGDLLPSTRRMATRLGISFHTVRRAYGDLVAEGLLAAVAGRGFTVLEREAEPKQDRMERGAEVMARTVERLVALGLDDHEMEYLLQEQISLLDSEGSGGRTIFVWPFTEFAERGAELVMQQVATTVEAVPLARLSEHEDAEYALVPFALARSVAEKLPRAEVIGVRLQLSPDALALAARLYDYETLVLVVRYPDAIAPLSRQIRSESGFGGQVIAAALDEGDARIGAIVRQADALLYTPTTARRLRPLLGSAPAHHVVEPVLDRSEAERIRAALPS